jgi:deoxyhypusine synthase
MAGKKSDKKAVKGYDFDKGVDYSELMKSFASSGLQAGQLANAVELVKEMIDKKAKIFLSYTSNMVTSGVREVIRYLVKNKKVDVLSTTAGGVEEDIMKCFGDFVVGDFKYSAQKVYDSGFNVAGNIKVHDDLYLKFEKFLNPILEELYKEQKEKGKAITPSELIWKLGEKIGDERSICYWAWKNKIPIFCNALTDGSLGTMVYAFQHKKEDFVIDIVEDTKRLNDSTTGLKKSGVVCLGGGLPKHSVLIAQIFRNGADYAVYINTGISEDGSDSGAPTREAITWGKLRTDAKHVKVFGDASILFPLLVAESFAKST